MAKWNCNDEKVCFIMIGVPASGKSTYLKKIRKEYPDMEVISFDNSLNTLAEQMGSTYDEIFNNHIKLANDFYDEYVKQVYNNSPPCIVYDQTCLTVKTRNKFTERARQNGYKVVYIFFNKPQTSKQAKVMFKRIENRKNKPIDDETIVFMYTIFQAPDLALEKPDEIIVVHNVWES